MTIAARVGADLTHPVEAAAGPANPLRHNDVPLDGVDVGDLQVLAALPTSRMLVLRITPENRIVLEVPRTEVGQGITTTMAMLVAEELDARLSDVDVPLSDARPELMFNQLTGGSTSVRAQWDPVRAMSAGARARLVTAAARRWNLKPDTLTTRDTTVFAPDGRSTSYGSLAEDAAKVLIPEVPQNPKPAARYTLIGKPTNRIDARAMVTGRQRYTLDLDVPGALPTVLRRPPTINGTVRTLLNEAELRAMSGVVDVAVIPSGIAVLARTFGQALAAKDAAKVTWNAGTIDGLSDVDIRKKLRAAALPFVVPPLTDHVDAEFDFAAVSHAPMETNSAIADVRDGRAEIWSGLKVPIVAQKQVAAAIGLPMDKVTVHVVQSGGSFGRRLFPEAAVEAARVSKATGKPVKLMWTRIDDMRHGRMRPAGHSKIRATLGGGKVLTFEQRFAAVLADWDYGLGDAFTSTGFPIQDAGMGQTVFGLSQGAPYDLGIVTNLLSEVDLPMGATSWRSVYSGMAGTAREIVLDEIAGKLRTDAVAFRRALLKNARQRAVLDKAASAGQWGRALPAGFGQGIGFHDEYKSCAAFLVEIDARDPKKPRVTRAVIAADVGLPINPRGLESQLLGHLTDGISTVLRAGLHIDNGLPLEGSYSQFHYARQRDSPRQVEIHLLPGNGSPGGAGELGVPAAAAAVANAYARATGTKPRSFPINFDVDFVPFPR